MSQTYNVSVKVCETLTEDDTQTQSLGLQKNILPEGEVGSLLKNRLREKGYTEREDGVFTKEDGDLSTEVDVDKGEVRTTVRNTETVEETVKGKGYSHGDNREEGEAKARVDAAAKSKDVIAAKRKAIQEAATKRLVDSEQERNEQMQDILTDVYKEALERKARSMGNLVDTQDTGEGVNREIVITVAL